MVFPAIPSMNFTQEVTCFSFARWRGRGPILACTLVSGVCLLCLPAQGDQVYLTNLVVSSSSENGTVVALDLAGGNDADGYDILRTASLWSDGAEGSIWTWIERGHTSNRYSFPGQPDGGAFYAIGSRDLAFATYDGLCCENNGIRPPSSGSFTAQVRPGGAFVAALLLAGHNYRFSGSFDPQGNVTNLIARPGQSPLVLRLHLDHLPPPSDQVSGALSDGSWSANLIGYRRTFDGHTAPSPYAGRYTLLVPGVPSSSAPGGDSWATLAVDAAGAAQIAGRLADGSTISSTTHISATGAAPVYVPLKGGQGCVLSWLQFASSAQSDLGGTVNWIKPAQPEDKCFPAGFDLHAEAIGSRYVRPGDGVRVLNLTEADFMLMMGDLAQQGFTNHVLLTTSNTVVNLAGNPLTLAISASVGRFEGAVADVVTGEIVPFSGVVMQKQNFGCGSFFGTGRSGRVFLGSTHFPIISIDGHAPAEAGSVSKKPVLVGPAYFFGGAPMSSTWQIATDSTFTNIIATATPTNCSLRTSIAVKPANFTFQNVPANRRELETAATYYLRVRYQDFSGVSAWSDAACFTTTPKYVSDVADVPVITLPDISQSDFQAAFDVLEARIVPDPVDFFGDYNIFLYPFQTPGDAYSYGWWQFDQNSMLGADKWTGLNFSDDVMRNWFIDQEANRNGHIDEVSSSLVDPVGPTGQPTFFAAAYDLARRASDRTFALDTYNAMKGLYLWFKGVRWYAPLGLIVTGDDEGIITLSKQVDNNTAMSVDLNALITVAARNLGTLANTLSTADVTYFQRELTNSTDAINSQLWDVAASRYRNLRGANGLPMDFFDAGTFYPLMGNIAGPARAAALVSLLTNSALFNWGASASSNLFPVTTLAKTDPGYTIFSNPADPADYSSDAWKGDIWTVVNFDIVRGLEDSGRNDLAAELVHQTLTLVNTNFYECFTPDGTHVGSPRYGWTAANYAQLIIEDLFGIDYDALSNTITVIPRIPRAYNSQQIAIGNVNIPTTGDKLSVTISAYSEGARTIFVSTDNPQSDYNLVVYAPAAYGTTATHLFDAATMQEITRNTSELSFEGTDLDGDGNVDSYKITTTLSAANRSTVSYKVGCN